MLFQGEPSHAAVLAHRADNAFVKQRQTLARLIICTIHDESYVDGATLFSLIEDHYWRGSLFTCPMADSYVG